MPIEAEHLSFNPRTPRGVRQRVIMGTCPEDISFNPRTPRGVRRSPTSIACCRSKFQSTHPARGATPSSPATSATTGRFNPRTPRGVRRRGAGVPLSGQSFQSTHPARGATDLGSAARSLVLGFNPRTPRGVRRPPGPRPAARRRFNPRTPRGVRQLYSKVRFEMSPFQSTHPARGATSSSWMTTDCCPQFQSTHPARGATRCQRSL